MFQHLGRLELQDLQTTTPHCFTGEVTQASKWVAQREAQISVISLEMLCWVHISLFLMGFWLQEERHSARQAGTCRPMVGVSVLVQRPVCGTCERVWERSISFLLTGDHHQRIDYSPWEAQEQGMSRAMDTSGYYTSSGRKGAYRSLTTIIFVLQMGKTKAQKAEVTLSKS